jgi:hypothetical protein
LSRATQRRSLSAARHHQIELACATQLKRMNRRTSAGSEESTLALIFREAKLKHRRLNNEDSLIPIF